MSITTARKGDWMQTASGGRFYPLDPRPEEIRIEDIAHALAYTNRFGGHARLPYSVAEHSVRVSLICNPDVALWGLLHDAAEAYLADLPRPIKRHPELAAYVEAEERLIRTILVHFHVPEAARWAPATPVSVARADEVLLLTEARDLMDLSDWDSYSPLQDIQPLAERIEPWGWREAEVRFLERFAELTGGAR